MEWLGVPLKADGRTVGRHRGPDLSRGSALCARGPGPARLCRAARRAPRWSAPVPSRRRDSATRSWRSSTRSAPRSPSSSTSQAIVELVGERVRQHLRARPRLFVALYDEPAGSITLPVLRSRGRSGFTTEPMEIGRGPDVAGHPGSRRLLRLGTLAEGMAARRSQRWEAPDRVLAGCADHGRRSTSSASSPSRAPNRTSTARPTSGCSSTLASSMGVALENARLFDETKRLLAETDAARRGAGDHQRDRRGAGEAARLPGDHRARRGAPRRDVFAREDMYIALYDRATDLISFPYELDHGQRIARRADRSSGEGLTSTRHPDRASPSIRDLGRPRQPWGVIGTYARRHQPTMASPGSACRSWPASEAIGVVVRLGRSASRRLHRGRRAARVTRSPRAWASRSRTRACSTRRSACWPRPTSAPRSWRSSTRSARALPSSSTSRRSSTLVGDRVSEIFGASDICDRPL